MEEIAVLVLAAGLGTRLGDLTGDRPKALVRAGDYPLLQHVLLKIRSEGFRHVVINVHHFPEQIIRFCEDHASFGLNLRFSDERSQLLDTGAALKRAETLFDEAEHILVHNVDILSGLSLGAFVRAHQQSGHDWSLSVRRRQTSRYLLMSEDMRLDGWINTGSGAQITVPRASAGSSETPVSLQRFAYSGVQVFRRSMLSVMPSADKPYPIVPEWLRLSENHRIYGVEDMALFWSDCGSRERLESLKHFKYDGVEYD